MYIYLEILKDLEFIRTHNKDIYTSLGMNTYVQRKYYYVKEQYLIVYLHYTIG